MLRAARGGPRPPSPCPLLGFPAHPALHLHALSWKLPLCVLADPPWLSGSDNEVGAR